MLASYFFLPQDLIAEMGNFSYHLFSMNGLSPLEYCLHLVQGFIDNLVEFIDTITEVDPRSNLRSGGSKMKIYGFQGFMNIR